MMGCHTPSFAGVFNAQSPFSRKGVDAFFQPSGNVGIGSYNPQSKLVVNGTITGGGSLPTGAVFFMATGSCPSWSTDVSATYANKYIKINATQLTSAGVVLTATSDAHTLTQAELPNISLALQIDGSTVGAKSAGGDGPNFGTSANGGNSHTATALLGGSGNSFTQTLSTASTLEPSSITMKACQVN